MSTIQIPVDPVLVVLLRRTHRIETRQIRVGRETQTRRERVESIERTPSGWTQASLASAVTGANQIWTAGHIQFSMSSPTTREFEVPGGETTVDENAYQYLINQIQGSRGRITLLAVSRFARWDLGGQASRGTCILPSNLTEANRGRVFAHEFGHLLGLDHVGEQVALLRNLMRPGLVAGPELTDDQIARARSSNLATAAQQTRQPQPSSG